MSGPSGAPTQGPSGAGALTLRLPGGRRLTFERVRVMGVVNVTPDSFSDGGRFLAPERAIEHGVALAAAGADVLDVGGESTRPGAAPVPADEQIRRVVPVIRGLAERTDALLSVDTTSARVAAAALDAGASVVNDISAFRFDPEMLPLLAGCDAAAIAMHTLAEPAVMQRAPRYDDVVAEVRAHLAVRLEAAAAAGVEPARLVLDPGIGFGKTLAHNLALVRRIDALASLGRPVLIGPSRKRFVGALTGKPVSARAWGTAGAVAAAVVYGAHMVRVHDVAEMVDVVRVAEAVVMAPGSAG